MTNRIDALMRQTQCEYCKCGALEKVTDVLGQATLHDYDDAGRRTKRPTPTAFGWRPAITALAN